MFFEWLEKDKLTGVDIGKASMNSGERLMKLGKKREVLKIRWKPQGLSAGSHQIISEIE